MKRAATFLGGGHGNEDKFMTGAACEAGPDVKAAALWYAETYFPSFRFIRRWEDLVPAKGARQPPRGSTLARHTFNDATTDSDQFGAWWQTRGRMRISGCPRSGLRSVGCGRCHAELVGGAILRST